MFELDSGMPDRAEHIPRDAWAIRQLRWDARHWESLFGVWHRTDQWLRHDGAVSGIVTSCNRVFTPDEVQLVGEPPMMDTVRDQRCHLCFTPVLLRKKEGWQDVGDPRLPGGIGWDGGPGPGPGE